MNKLIGLFTLLALAPLGFGGEGASAKPGGVFQLAGVQRGPIEATFRATGTIEPEEVVDVGAQVAGQIQKFGQAPHDATKTVDFGTHVEEGTVLAQIDPSLYEADVEQARAGLKRAMAELQVASAEYQRAERDWARARQLGEKAISATDLMAYQSKYDIAKAKVEVAKAGVLQSEAVLRRSQINLGYCTIRSPIKGVIIDRRVNVGQTVLSSLSAPSLFLIAKDLKRLQVWASVHEADIGQINKCQAVRFTVDAFPKKVFRGEVAQIRLNAAMTKNIVRYTVAITTDNPDGKLLPYMTADVQFEVARRQNALLVPSAALRWRPQLGQVAPSHRLAFARAQRRPKGEPADQDRAESAVVWVEEKGFVRPVEVHTGLTDGTRTEIVDGLEDGALVVIGVTEAAPEEEQARGRAAEAKRILAGLEVKTLLVQPATASSGGVSSGTGSVGSLTVVDAEAIARECPAVSSAAPIRRARTQVAYGDRTWVPLYVYGTTPSYLEVRDWRDLAEGELFSNSDVRSGKKVCVVGQTPAHELFGDASPVGKSIRLGGVPFRVIGVLSRKGANSMGIDQDDVLITPWSAMEPVTSPAKPGPAKPGALSDLYPAPAPGQSADTPKLYTASGCVDQILVRAKSADAVPAAGREISELLRKRHHIRPGQPDDFDVRDMTELAKALKSKAR
jgi:HlyD family secretion protein